MPQMAPLMWTTLYLIFTTLLIMSASKLFYSLSAMPSSSIEISLKKEISPLKNLMWKW